MIKKDVSLPTLGIIVILSLSLLGELYRFHGFLLLDLFTPIFVFAWIANQIIQKKSVFLPKTVIPAGLFLLIGFASLLIRSGNLSWRDFFESAFYGLRWASLFVLSIIATNQNQKNKNLIFYALAVFALLLAIAGFIQLKLVPDFTAYEALGWDPHQNRLLSTWFDPNFVGGFLSFIIPVFIGAFFSAKHNSSRIFFLVLLSVLFIALALTFSRSSYLALTAGLAIFALLKSKKLLLIFGIILVVAVTTVPEVRTRVNTLKQDAVSVLTESYTLPDDSARLRYSSWKEGLTLFYKNPLIGQGYNRYKFATLEGQTSVDPSSHASTGSDSSLITILATTGVLGFLPFLAVYFLLLFSAWQSRTNLGTGFLAGLLALLIHATFVNSLLFPLLSAPFWITSGLILCQRNPAHNSNTIGKSTIPN
ncbi:MAG: O-antigen ligase family protein [Candidatus Gracilibacteria bacterium]